MLTCDWHFSMGLCVDHFYTHQRKLTSCDPEHIPFGGNLSRMHYYSSVSINIQHLKCLVSPTPKTWLGGFLTGHVILPRPLEGHFVIPRLTLDMLYL